MFIFGVRRQSEASTALSVGLADEIQSDVSRRIGIATALVSKA